MAWQLDASAVDREVKGGEGGFQRKMLGSLWTEGALIGRFEVSGMERSAVWSSAWRAIALLERAMPCHWAKASKGDAGASYSAPRTEVNSKGQVAVASALHAASSSLRFQRGATVASCY